MITTISTSSVTTVTAMIGAGAVLGMIVLTALVVFLSVRETALVSAGIRRRLLGRSLSISVVPLIIAFVVIAVMQVLEIMALI